jgi:hypothetical protein
MRHYFSTHNGHFREGDTVRFTVYSTLYYDRVSPSGTKRVSIEKGFSHHVLIKNGVGMTDVTILFNFDSPDYKAYNVKFRSDLSYVSILDCNKE